MRRRKHTILPDHRSIQDPGRLVSEIKEVQFKCTNRGTLVYKRRIKHLITREKACTVKGNLNIAFGFLYPVTSVGVWARRKFPPRRGTIFISLERIARNTSQNMPKPDESGSAIIKLSRHLAVPISCSYLSLSLIIMLLIFISEFVCEINFGFQLFSYFPYYHVPSA